MTNTGSAIALVGLSYLGLTFGFSWWVVGLMIMAAGTWGFQTMYSERKQIIKAQTRYWEARAELEERKVRVPV